MLDSTNPDDKDEREVLSDDDSSISSLCDITMEVAFSLPSFARFDISKRDQL